MKKKGLDAPKKKVEDDRKQIVKNFPLKRREKELYEVIVDLVKHE